MAYVLVFMLGGLGSALRYAVGLALASQQGWPSGTLMVNVVGSTLLAFVATVAGDARALGVEWRVMLGTGLLGGFTTYSAFNLEVLTMLQKGSSLRAGMYLFATVLGCLLGALLGAALARGVRA